MSLSDDYAALRHGCGLADRSAAGRLALSGADRQRFLNGQVTCDVKGLTPGTGAYGFFTSPQGKILADVAVLAGPEKDDPLWLELPPGRAEAIAAQLRKYIIVDRVEVRPLDEIRLHTLIGPRAGEALAQAGLTELPERPWSSVAAAALGEGGRVVRQDGLGASAWTLWLQAEREAEWRERLLALEGGAAVRPVGPEALEVLRAEAGIPRYGVDYGADNFPQESGLEERAVSYTKGCYLGQEVVARIHYRGGVHKGLAGLVFDAADAADTEMPAVGAKLLHEGKEVGTVTTAVHSPALGRAIGLAVLNLRATEPGTRLALGGGGEGGGQAEIHPLPFVAAP
ncbi:MAG TPA: glycine cleavage T C-terminal barrel domain-containing protein [Thermoanaerobaculia bacterium]|nr:glycine cleavage T C-terminal barrel domain-containing protein [Thermoanaerobaculia bacterium]